MRRFNPGDLFEIGGMHFRVVPGSKTPRGPGQDLRLDWLRSDGCWRPVKMAHAGLIVDFFFENEDVLYPPPQFDGGRRFTDYLKHGLKHGWQSAEAGLRIEKEAKLFDERELA